MSRTATQQSQKSKTRAQVLPPRPATQPDFADTEDSEYGLVSVLYHALQGAQACEQYTDDAERAGDEGLAQFFRECRDAQNERASRAKKLLVERADEDPSEEDEESDSDDDA